MPSKVRHIRLSSEERAALEKVSGSTHRSEREKKRARILLLCDSSLSREAGGSRTDDEVVAQLKCSVNTVYLLRQRALERGVIAVIQRAEQTSRKARKLDGVQEAHLVTIVCPTPPEGASRWSLRLIRDRLIEMEVVKQIGLETIRTTLKKTTQAVAEENVVSSSQRRCSFRSGHGRCFGSVCCFDYAQIVKWMCDQLYPTAHKIVLVQDNLNTHGPHSLYRAFEPQEARRLIERIEWHFTPRANA